MKKFIAVVVVGLALAGCDPVTLKNPLPSYKNPVSATNLYQANLAYDGALKAFNKMKDLCERRVIPNTCRTYVIGGQRVIPQAEKARKIASDFIRQNPTIDAGALVNAYTLLIGNLEANAAQRVQ